VIVQRQGANPASPILGSLSKPALAEFKKQRPRLIRQGSERKWIAVYAMLCISRQFFRRTGASFNRLKLSDTQESWRSWLCNALRLLSSSHHHSSLTPTEHSFTYQFIVILRGIRQAQCHSEEDGTNTSYLFSFCVSNVFRISKTQKMYAYLQHRFYKAAFPAVCFKSHEYCSNQLCWKRRTSIGSKSITMDATKNREAETKTGLVTAEH
jgi:hypothetical protein